MPYILSMTQPLYVYCHLKLQPNDQDILSLSSAYVPGSNLSHLSKTRAFRMQQKQQHLRQLIVHLLSTRHCCLCALHIQLILFHFILSQILLVFSFTHRKPKNKNAGQEIAESDINSSSLPKPLFFTLMKLFLLKHLPQSAL